MYQYIYSSASTPKCDTIKTMTKKNIKNRKNTPYFLFDINKIKNNINCYKNRKFILNYSVKSCLFDSLVKETEHLLDGFTVSSKGDLKKVRTETQKPIHFVSPLIRDSEIKIVNSIGNSIAFNSLNQFYLFEKSLSSHIKTFIRINPEKSFLKDSRYNPCKPYSQLGVPISLFVEHLKSNSFGINGIHFHNNCQSDFPEHIIETMNYIEACLGDYLYQLQYIDMGGGYLYSEEFIDILNELQNKWNKKYGVTFIIEPGFDISNNAGFLISSVVDIFENRDKNIAILDTTVNHLPEVFEYKTKPQILNQTKVGYNHILCGCTCLAGDVFGEYSFEKPLEIGDNIIFKNVGSYSYVKAHTFNGIEKPKLNITNSTEFHKDYQHFKDAV